MYTRPSAPRSIGGVLDDALRLYRASARHWWLPSALAALLSAGTGMAMFNAVGTNPTPAQMLGVLKSPLFWGGNLVMIGFEIFVYCAMVALINDVFLGATPTLGGAFGASAKAWPSALLAGILFMLAITGGTVLFVIPGIYMFGRLQFSQIALMAERLSGRKSLTRSSELVKGHWWRASAIVSTALVMTFVLVFVMSFTLGITGALFHANPAMFVVVNQVLSALLNILILPAFPAVYVATYYDLRLRKEGGDLAARVTQLASA